MDPYRDIASFYDCEHAGFTDDVEFYLQQVQCGPVLEVGCGTGRITLPLAARGFEVWGIDPSPAMLERARRRLDGRANAHLQLASATEVRLDQTFRTALLPLNTLWHLESLDAQLSALRNARRHLHSGFLVIDVSNPLELADRGAKGDLRLRFRSRCDGQELVGLSAAWDDEANQTLELTLMYDLRGPDASLQRTQTQLSLRYVYRWELELLVRLAGFRVEHVYGGYDLEPYAAESPQILLVGVTDD